MSVKRGFRVRDQGYGIVSKVLYFGSIPMGFTQRSSRNPYHYLVKLYLPENKMLKERLKDVSFPTEAEAKEFLIETVQLWMKDAGLGAECDPEHPNA